ncbi:MAG: DUF3857 domain-containing protein [Marinosulfonomonas sp.]
MADYATTGATPDWVDVQDFPAEDVSNPDARYLLVDRQVRVTKTNDEWYFRYVEKLNTPQNVQDGSTISIVVDPEFETVQLHHLRIIRDGTPQDLLDLSQFDFYRVETDREMLIYNGNMEMSFHVPGVRRGDVLDYAYTYSGRNPAFGKNYSLRFSHGYAVDVEHLHNRLLIANDMPIFYTSLGGAVEPEVTKFGNHTEYAWLFEPAAEKDVDSNTPPSYVGWPRTEISSLEGWDDVGRHFAQHYQMPERHSQEIEGIAAEIRAHATTKSAQLRAALGFVQREIRYLGVELGAGGYVPRAPDTVLARRFGDCKDMTLLLIAILDALDIKAAPLLVQSEVQSGIKTRQPSILAFNHVIVAATLDEKTYFLDPTRGEQLGDLDHLQQGDFGKGVIIAPDSPGMIDVVAPKPDFYEVITDAFDAQQDPDDISFTHTATYYMGAADYYWTAHQNGTLDDIERSDLKRFQKRFPTLEQTTPLSIDTDEENAKVTLSAAYRIADAWSESDDADRVYFSTYAQDLYDSTPAYVGGKRTAPLAIRNPVRTEHTIRLLLNGPWDLPTAQETYDHPAYFFEKKSIFLNGIYTNVLTYKTRSDNISPEDFKDAMADIKKINDAVDVGVELSIQQKN